MKILVCVKQVPETETALKIDDSGRRIQIDKSTLFRMNRFDEFAVEEALLIKETFSDTRIDALTVGPTRSAMVVRRAMGMGADHGIHILMENEGFLSPFAIASWIAAYAQNNAYDLILAGVMAEDDMEGQVGPMVAERLSLPCATSAIFEKLAPDKKSIYVEREMEGGFRDTLELHLPALLTIQSGMNKPRYPSLSNILRAKKEKLETIEAMSIEQPKPPQSLVRLAYPQKLRSALVLRGTEQEKAAQLLQILGHKFLVQ